MKIELHCHTLRSHDGFTSLEDLLAECRARGIRAVALSEHDVTCARQEWPNVREGDPFLIPSVELTTDKGVHLIALFTGGRPLPSRQSLANTIQAIRSAGALLSIPHPGKTDSGLLAVPATTPEEIDLAFSAATFVELYNGGVDLSRSREAVRTLADRHGVLGVAASDAHKPWQVGVYLTDFDVGEVRTLEDLKARMPESRVRCLRRTGFLHPNPAMTLVRRVRHSGTYQSAIARVPYSWKRAVRMLRYARALRRYQGPAPCLYEEIE